MAQAPDWKPLIEAGRQMTELRRSQARRIVSDLVRQGHVARDQATTVGSGKAEAAKVEKAAARRPAASRAPAKASGSGG